MPILTYLNIKSNKTMNKKASILYWQRNQIAEIEGCWKILKIMNLLTRKLKLRLHRSKTFRIVANCRPGYYSNKKLYFVKVNVDGSALKNCTNWDKQSCLSLYIFLSFWGNERRQFVISRSHDQKEAEKHTKQQALNSIFISAL